MGLTFWARIICFRSILSLSCSWGKGNSFLDYKSNFRSTISKTFWVKKLNFQKIFFGPNPNSAFDWWNLLSSKNSFCFQKFFCSNNLQVIKSAKKFVSKNKSNKSRILNCVHQHSKYQTYIKLRRHVMKCYNHSISYE